MLDAQTKENILQMFAGADLSVIKEVLYFGGWQNYEEYGRYLIFRGVDDSLQCCEYGYSPMAKDNINYFLPVEITHEEHLAMVAEMEPDQGMLPY